MAVPSLGIDVAQATLACCLLADGRTRRREVPNTPTGFQQLVAWVQQQPLPAPPTVTLEATGGYEEAVATHCYDQGWTVYRVNPYRVRRWAEGALLRSKTDALDAWVLAEFGRTAPKLHPWAPVAPAFRDLQALVRARAALQESRQAYRNRQQAPGCPTVAVEVYTRTLAVLDRELAAVEQHIRTLIRTTPALRQAHRLLTSIIGIGHDTAALLLGECGDCSQFRSGKQLVAFTGISVQEHTSGTSVHKPARVSKRGSPRLRAALYFPAITAMTWNPRWHAWAEQLAARGKTKKQLICAIMRKLLELVYAVLRTGQPFERAYVSPWEEARRPCAA